MELNYDKAHEYLEKYAKKNGAEHFEIVEESYEYEHGLVLIVYHDKEHQYEDYSVCIDVRQYTLNELF